MKSFIILLYLFPLITCCQHPGSSDSFPGSPAGTFIYYPPARALLLVGNTFAQSNSTQSDVWKWNGTKWSKTPASGPGSRDFFEGAFNPETGTLYCFGGKDNPGGVFWSFDGAKWTKVFIKGLGTRDHHQVVYADHLNAFVVYGGNNEKETLDTLTWLIKNGESTALNIPGPGIRYHSGMAYDKHRKKVVLYGGGDNPSELWEFDGTKWEKITRDISPGKKLYHRMVYDENAKMVILHGGWQNQDPKDPVNSLTPATWGWDGNAWTKITEERIFNFALGYDAERKLVVAYGRTGFSTKSGLGLWNLQNGRWIKIAGYGIENASN